MTATEQLRRAPQQERGREKVRRILDAADKLLATHGAQVLTTPRVAEAAGVAVGTVYRWFPDKDAIVEALAVEHWSQLQALVAGVADRHEREQGHAAPDPIHDALHAVASGFRARPGFLALWFGPLRTERLRDVTRPGREDVAASLERLLAVHHPKAPAAQRAVVARMLVLVGDGLVREAFRADRDGDPHILSEGEAVLRAYTDTRLRSDHP